MAPDMSLDRILQEITTATNLNTLHQTLKTGLPKESRDTILSSPLASGQDPLNILDLTQNTLGVLYILCVLFQMTWSITHHAFRAARLSVTNIAVHPQVITTFCATFLPEQARLAPERVTALAKGIYRYGLSNGSTSWAVQPLFNLLTRYPPDTSYLTTIHPVFLQACVVASQPSAALPILATPIANVSTLLSDLTYNDNLVYHYLGGVALAMLKRWADAEEYFEICVTAPGSAPAALQLEALKKLRLVQLISRGETTSLPKYAHSSLPRMFKNSVYTELINAYPQNIEKLHGLVDKEKPLFSADKNLGLIQQAIERAPRWTLRKLTATYVALGLADIARLVGIPSEDDVRSLLLSMIEAGEIFAQISASGTVTFSDPPPQFSREEVDSVLRSAQTQSALLEGLDMDMARSREFITKAVKGQDGGGMWPGPEEDLYAMAGASGPWAEDSMFA
ncbi:PCI domain-containing protein [Mycena indigotica]|uniref:COP9 signalosome complex subunit 3 n=1 Tax=Mycena indigotica TaxID=2126181 RepID=A0A8H6SYF0_9AGAR|nr:PCI domain-containing protein [Mycena indigotica]KAF7307639.1 PCI domain-containing protein [Mycena indigotica]